MSLFSSVRHLVPGRYVQWVRTLSVVTLGLVSSNAWATNLVTNGSFETNGGVGELSVNTTASGWTVGSTTDGAPNPFAFIADAQADSTGFPSVYSPPNILLWGPNTPVGNSDPNHSYPGPGSHPIGPVNNGFNGTPDGNYFLGVDGAYANAPVSQLITGLTVGEQYTLSFIYAGAQFTDALGDNTEGWQVTFGSDSVSTPILSNASQGFTGWQTFTTTFTATSTSQTLSFLAIGGPAGLPPFALLDSVDLEAVPPSPVPEPSTIVLLGSSLLILGAVRRRKRAA